MFWAPIKHWDHHLTPDTANVKILTLVFKIYEMHTRGVFLGLKHLGK